VALFVTISLVGVGWMLVGVRDGRGGQEAWWSLLREFVLIPLALGLPLFVGVVSGTALAADRRSRSLGQVMVRGVTRLQWVASHLVASALAAGVTVGGVVMALALLIRTVGPSGGTSEVFAAVPHGFPAGGTWLAVAFGLLAFAAAAFWAGVFCVVGLLTTNLFAVICIPPVANLVIDQAGNAFGSDGLERIMTLDRLGPGPWPNAAVWVIGMFVAVAIALVIATRRETLG
jgi:hypothetical protein